MSPPWGGPEYKRDGDFDVILPFDGLSVGLAGLISISKTGLRTVTGKHGRQTKHGTVAIFLPRNSSRRQIHKVIPPEARYSIEEEHVSIGQKQQLKGITVYVRFA